MWVASPVIELLPFEFPGIGPREVVVVAALINTVTGMGFAVGPVVVGAVAEYTGSLQTGLLVLTLMTGVGAGLSHTNLCQKNGREIRPPN